MQINCWLLFSRDSLSRIISLTYLSPGHLQAPTEQLKEAVQPYTYHHDKDVHISPREGERQIDSFQDRYLPEVEVENVVDVRSPGQVEQFQDVFLQFAHSLNFDHFGDGDYPVENRLDWRGEGRKQERVNFQFPVNQHATPPPPRT